MIVDRRLGLPARARAAICALFLLGCLAFFFWPILFEGRVPVFRDLLGFSAPVGSFIGARLREGRLPQWFPYDGLGEALIGQLNTAVFHPSTWLYAVLPTTSAMRFQLLLGYLAALSGQLVFARKLGLSWTSSVLAAVAFSFSGYAVSLSNVLPYLWGMATLPWLGFFAAQVFTQDRPWPWVSALALAWGTIVVAGDSHSALFGGLVVFFAGAATNRLRRLPLCMLAALIAIGLAGAELVPALDLVREGPRGSWHTAGNREALSTAWALHPYRLPELAFPGWIPLRALHWVANLRYREGGVWALTVYSGAPVLALALVTLCSRRKRAGVLALVMALLGLWLATGRDGGLQPLVQRLPLRFPEKYLALWALGLSLAAAAGLDQLREKTRGWIPIALAVAACACVLCARALPPDAGLRLWPELRAVAEPAEPLLAAAQGALTATGLSLLAAAAILAGGRRRAGLLMLMPLLVFLDLWAANFATVGVVEPGVLAAPARFCTAARAQGAGPAGLRVLNAASHEREIGEMDDPPVYVAHTLNRFGPAVGALCGIGSVSRDSIVSNEPRWVRWAIGSEHMETNPALGLYGFGLVVRSRPDDPPLKDEKILDVLPVLPGQELVLVRRPAAPRAFAAIPRWVPDGASALREIQEHGLGLVESPVLAGSGPAFTGTGSAGTVVISLYQPEQVVLDARMERSGAVILNDLATRGWTATLDGAPARIYRANGIARGVLVPAGDHRVTMEYRLPGLRAGLVLSSASLLLCALLLAAGARKRGPQSSLAPFGVEPYSRA